VKYRKDKLAGLLKLLRRLVDKSNVLGETICFLPGKLVGYDGMVSMQIPFDTDLSCGIEPDKLLSVLNGVKDSEVDLSLRDGVLKLSSADTKAELKVNTDIEMFEVFDTSSIKFKPLPRDLPDAMYLVSFSTSRDITNKVFSCVYVDGDMLFATDNFRVSKYTLAEPVDASFLIPAPSIVKLISFSKEFPLKGFTWDGAWIHFTGKGGAMFSCRLFLDEEFPKRDAILPLFEIEGKEFCFPPEVKEAVEVVSFLVKDQFELDRIVSITIRKDKVICRAEREGEWVEKIVPFQGNEEFQFLCNPTFMIEALGRAFEVVVGERSILFRSQSGSFEHLVALCIEE